MRHLIVNLNKQGQFAEKNEFERRKEKNEQ